MDYRLLGRTGVQVSPLCLGALNFGDAANEADAIRIIHAAIDASVNFVDTANVYNEGRSESIVGKALAASERRGSLARARSSSSASELLPVMEMTLSDEERAACDAINPPGSVVVDFHSTAPRMKMRIPGV